MGRWASGPEGRNRRHGDTEGAGRESARGNMCLEYRQGGRV
ncbi:MAG: hypothetical protein AVDCRST_MAG18-2081 [uncultured Thermomicrobiales bacterium]|uniref:Uncharacterized protein n=1 Tax=uncultured Thermomicrobiales bacterium TaxID=1645740 RepID=A0A6J4V9D5_9BACT|nr:MAG: hypothetical protein AVDCRST_MAG18-2081 [uncultured Thermomicrobiales bacterium]